MTSPPISRRREWLLRLVLLGFSLACCAVTLELVARVLDARRGGGKEANERDRYLQLDPYLGWRPRPGASAVYRRQEYTVEVRINAHGLRDRERPAQPTGPRLLALGDSFVEGYTVPLEATVTQQLEAQLQGCAAEVWNGGVGGYSTDQEYLYFVHHGAALEPRVTLLFLYYNDILANTIASYWGTPKPLLEERGGQLEIRNFPVAQPRPPAAAEPAETTAAAREPRPYLHGSAALDWFANRLMRGAPGAFQALSRLGLWEPLGDDGIDEQMLVYKNRRGQKAVEAGWVQTGRILSALSAAVSSRGSRFVLVYVPSRMEVSDRDWELTRLRYALNLNVWDRGLVARRLAAMARAEGYPLLDLTEALRAVDKGVLGEPYFRIDGHWNERGHRAAAAALAAFLRERGLLPAGC